MVMPGKVVLKTRSLIPLTARVLRILKSWRWNSRPARGASAMVNSAPMRATATAATSTGTHEPDEPDAGGLAGDDLEVAGQAPAGQQHGHQQGHGQAEG